MSDGSGGAPQLDERALEAAVAAWWDAPKLARPREAVSGAVHAAVRAYLAASPGAGEAKERIERMRELTEEVGRLNKRIHGRAGELDLTDGEVQAILRNLPTEPGFHLGFGGNFNAAVAKLRARLDRKDDDG